MKRYFRSITLAFSGASIHDNTLLGLLYEIIGEKWSAQSIDFK